MRHQFKRVTQSLRQRKGKSQMKRLLATATTALVVSVMLVLIPAGVAFAASSALPGGATMWAGQYLTSPNAVITLVMQGDGNLVEYMNNPYGKDAMWSTGTGNNPGAHATMQGDGNLVVYSAGGAPLWWSGTQGHPGSYLLVQNDANVVIYGTSGALWADQASSSVLASSGSLWPGQSLVSTDHQHTLVMQGDGNLVEYAQYPNFVWYSGTQGNPGAHATMLSNGHLVILSANWSVLADYVSYGAPRLGLYYLAVPVFYTYSHWPPFSINGPY